MSKKVVGSKKAGRPPVPILKSRIEEAQRHTTSNTQAAKWLGVDYATYKRYAKIYGIFDRHANPLGLGTTKGFAKRPTSAALRDIFANKRPNYSMIRLKWRMLARGMLADECGMCGFNERRLTDKKSPLMLTFKNTDGDYARDNLWLLCYNCMFLTKGAPWVAHHRQIKASLTKPEYSPNRNDVPKYMDHIDLGNEVDSSETPELEGNTDWQKDILKELGR